MSKFLFSPRITSVPIFRRSSLVGLVGADDGASSGRVPAEDDVLFPVRRIYCVGRNYRKHTLEMGGDPDREPPFFFQKPADSVVVCRPGGQQATIPYPSCTSNLHYEAELIVAIGEDQEGKSIQADEAMGYVFGFSVGCDLTRRDLQSEAKQMRRPWDAAKSFDSSCPMSPITPKEDLRIDLDGASIELRVNGEMQQQSGLDKMIFSVPDIVANLSKLFRLQKGDLIMTGTPEGVGAIVAGDSVSIVCGELSCNFDIIPS